MSAVAPDPFDGGALDVSYQIQAHYTGGGSSWSAAVPLEANTISASIVGGSQGSAYVTTTPLPSGTTALQVTLIDEGAWFDYLVFGIGDEPINPAFEIPVSDPTQNQFLIPASDAVAPTDAEGDSSYAWYVQATGTNGNSGMPAYCPIDGGNVAAPYFFDGRAQLKQNLVFMLRAALADQPFEFFDHGAGGAWVSYPSDYAYAGFYQNDQYYNGVFNTLQPFVDNYRYRNFVFDPAYLDYAGRLTNGVGVPYYDTSSLAADPSYQFVAPTTNGATIPALLATNETRWLASALGANDWEFGITNVTGIFPATWYMANNVRNQFGLPFLSIEVAWNYYGLQTATLLAGGNLTQGGSVFFYPETAQPQLQTTEYDFWQRSPVPGSSSFATTNASDVLIAPVGGSITVNGYAKLAVLNGYSGVYGYLGQYFTTNAYALDSSGNITTNATGILSPYGNYFATEPGPAALVTMPDIDTGQRGTGVVYAVSLNVDANHDGNMDLSFNGADATSQASPMEFWVNNGNDQPGNNGNLDKDIPVPPNPPNYTLGEITCQRDLENLARLWVCGVPSVALYPNYTFTLSFQNVSGNPAINVYPSCETNGGIGYLTDTNVAATQTASAYYDNKWGTVSNGQSYTLPLDGYGKLLFTNFLFEGAGIGEGELTLTISENGNTIAQTGVWLDLHDVKDYFEQDVIQDSMSGAKSNWTSYVETVLPASSSVFG